MSLIVILMLQNVPYVNALMIEINLYNQPILIAAHIKDDERSNKIGMWIVGSDRREIGSTCFSSVVKPAIEWPLGFTDARSKVSLQFL